MSKSKEEKLRNEIIELSGQIINGMMSADSSIFTKIIDRTLHKNIADTAVGIAVKMIEKIDEYLQKNTEKLRN